jgi:hypothetical protein
MPGAYRQQDDGLAAALGIHLCVYCAVAACFALGLYALLQPSRLLNPGLAAYKPPPGTIIAYVQQPPRLNDVAAQAVPMAPAVLTRPELETTGRSTHQAVPEPSSRAMPEPRIAEPSVRQPKAKPRREARSESPTPQPAACLSGYDSSGAQTRSC